MGRWFQGWQRGVRGGLPAGRGTAGAAGLEAQPQRAPRRPPHQPPQVRRLATRAAGGDARHPAAAAAWLPSCAVAGAGSCMLHVATENSWRGMAECKQWLSGLVRRQHRSCIITHARFPQRAKTAARLCNTPRNLRPPAVSPRPRCASSAPPRQGAPCLPSAGLAHGAGGLAPCLALLPQAPWGPRHHLSRRRPGTPGRPWGIGWAPPGCSRAASHSSSCARGASGGMMRSSWCS